MKVILITHPGGGHSVMAPAPSARKMKMDEEGKPLDPIEYLETLEEFYERIAETDCPKTSTWSMIDSSEIPPDPVVVPSVVSPRQIRKALRTLGLHSAVEAIVTTLDDEAREEWEYTTEIHRDNQLVVGAAKSIGKTDAEIDDLFILAATY